MNARIGKSRTVGIGFGLLVVISFVSATPEVWAGERPGVVTPYNGEAVLIDLGFPTAPPGLRGVGPGFQAGADHIIAQQCNDGGWGWPHDNCTVTYNNITGAIALGILHAHSITADPAHLAAAIAGGDFDLTSAFPDTSPSFGSFAPGFLYQLSVASGNSAYSTFAEVGFFDALTAGTYGDATVPSWAAYAPADTYDYIARHKANRPLGGAAGNLRPWDMLHMPWVAGLIGNADSTTPADGISQQDTFRDLSVLDGLDTLDAGFAWDLIGLAGGVNGLALNGTTSFTALTATNFPAIAGHSTLCDLANTLAGFQNATGSWSWNSALQDPVDPTDEDTQATAYAVMALVAAEAHTCGPYTSEIDAGRAWLRSMQLPDGGFMSYPGGSENTEVESEALNALAPDTCTDDVLEFVLAAGSDCVKPGETVTVELYQRNLQQVVRGYQAFAQFDSAILNGPAITLTTSPYGVGILDSFSGESIDIAAGIDDDLGQTPTSSNGLLATLDFTPVGVDGPTTISFRSHGPPSRFSDVDGYEIVPCLIESPTIVIDGTPPVISCPTNGVVECDVSSDPSNTGAATATDNLDPNPMITFSDVVTPGACPQESVITRTWTATDCAGNESTCVQIITIVDSTPPTGTLGTIDACYPTAFDAEAAAIAATTDLADNCTVVGDLVVTAATAGSCSATITVTVTDECGNSTDFLYSTRIDATPPALTCPLPPGGGLIISELMDGTWPDGLPKFVELANCSDTPVDLAGYSLGNINNGAPTMGYDALILSGILASGDAYVVSYESGDSPGHSTFWDVYGFDADNLDQGAFINGDDVLALFVGAAYAGDPVDGSGAPVLDVYGEIGVDGTGQVWEYTDGFSYRKPYVVSGNASTFDTLEWTFGGADSLEGANDTIELALMLANTTPGAHACGGGEVVEYTDPGVCSAEVTLGVTASDNCDGALPVAYEADLGAGFVPITDPYTFDVGTWDVRATATDGCGNVGSCGFTVTVVDNEDPTATAGTIADCYPTAADAETAAIAATTNLADNCTAPGDLLVTASTVGDCSAVVTVVVSDEAGNSTSFDYLTTIDGTAPDITCPTFVAGDLIISEVVDGTIYYGEPKFVEITNCTLSDVDLSEYRIAVYSNGNTSENFNSMDDYGDMVGVLASGDSFVIGGINLPNAGGPNAEFLAVYGFEADLYDSAANGNGDDVYWLLKDNGMGGDIVIDSYGEWGVDGTGTAWEYLDSYAYSLPGRSANGGIFNASNWAYGGPNALDGVGTSGMAAVTTPGTHDCSNTLTVNADAGGCNAVVTYLAPTATDNCDPAPVVVCDWPSGSTFPAGTTMVTCTATDDCGNEGLCSFDVEVRSYNDLVVTVELQPNIDTGAPEPDQLTRCITFELWECSGPSSVAVSEEIVFDVTDGGSGNPNIAIGTATIDVPCGSYSCVTARDTLHTLRRTDESFHIASGQYVADFTGDPAGGGDWLIGGNLNDDFWIDILDFGVFSFQFGNTYGAPVSGDTDCATSPPHADISGDGVVDNLDFSFIQNKFLTGHEANCCGAPGLRPEEGNGPVTDISILELRRMGLGKLGAGDLNRDGRLNIEDVAAFLDGARPRRVTPIRVDQIEIGDVEPAIEREP